MIDKRIGFKRRKHNTKRLPMMTVIPILFKYDSSNLLFTSLIKFISYTPERDDYKEHSKFIKVLKRI